MSELKRKFRTAWPHLDERTRRIMAAAEAVSLGYGGVSVVRRACGLSRKAISKGIREIQGGGKPWSEVHRKDPSMRSHQATSHAKDKYFKAIGQHWDIISRAYLIYEDKRPVILLDVTEGMIYAYPYKRLKAQLSERGQASLTEQYNEGLQKNQFVIFVRDSEKKKLMSYSMNRPVVGGSVPLDRYELTFAVANTDPSCRHSHRISTARQQYRIRRPGGGRKLTEEKDPTVVNALEQMVVDEVAGDPMTEQKWIRSSLSRLSKRLKEEGHQASTTTVARLLKKMGFSLKANTEEAGPLGMPGKGRTVQVHRLTERMVHHDRFARHQHRYQENRIDW